MSTSKIERVGPTKGPWQFERENDGIVAFRIAGEGTIIADVWFRTKATITAPLPEIAEANARLMAQAPALLEACKAFMHEWNMTLKADFHETPLRPVADKCIAAIKAVEAQCT